MDEYEQAIENAAKDLYKVYWTEVTPGLMQNWNDWDLVQESQKQGWRAVARVMAASLSNYVAIYGYNGKGDYQGLDQFIKP